MLKRVKTFWLKGVLEESLHGAELIDLALAYRPSAVARRPNLVAEQTGLLPVTRWQQEDDFDQPLPIGTKIIEVFDQVGRTLLIMGEPGAGKTTTLLQLVSDLLARAELDETGPIPVVFSLSSWSDGNSMAQWMVNELSHRYEVPRKLGGAWLQAGQFLPLFDGLDEVEKSRRPACAAAINEFRQSHFDMATVVTCRSRDYQALDIHLRLANAIVLQPLATAQIDTYLAGLGKRLAGLRAALQTDETMRDLAQSPLMLSIMTLAYYRMPADIAISLGNREVGRKLLFDVYVERMARYRSGEKMYAPEDTIRWLAWLAGMMAQRNQTLFFLEGLQPDWLPPDDEQQFTNRLKLMVVVIMLAVGLVAGMVGLIAAGRPALLLGVALGGGTALVTAASGRFLLRAGIDWQGIETTETLNWSWPHAAVGLVAGAVVGGVGGWLLAAVAHMASAVVTVLAIVAGLSQVLENALVRNDMKMRTTPGQGIERSWRNGRIVGLAAGIITLFILGMALVVTNWLQTDFSWQQTAALAVWAALYLGVSGGLMYGGLAILQHRRLLHLLQQKHVIPQDLVHFLDYAAERNLLRKVGGGYMFVHALLLDYFTTCETDM